MKEEINTMPKTSLYNMEGAAIGEVELSEELFAAPINTAAMHLVVRSILANQRQGTQSALTRGEVRGGGRKIYRQKGTGNARHHGNRAPQFRHGGVVFAPKPRDYVINVPKKIRRLAFKSAMTYEILLIVVIGGIGSISGSCIASFLFIACNEWWLRFLDNEMYIGARQVPLLRTGFRKVVFSVIIMAVVLFYRQGIMGDRELSVQRMARLVQRRTKAARTGGKEG